MTHQVIYVPQGRTVRLNLAKDRFFTGIYTNNFSVCNIIIIAGNSKVVLAHADRSLASIAATLLEDLQWVGEGASMSIYRRTNSVITNILFDKFKLMRLSITPLVQELSPQVEGIFIEKNDNGFELKLVKSPRDVSFKLHHHPLEIQMETIQKLNQLFGIREDRETKLRKIKQVNIYDGQHWVSIPDNELKLTSQHHLSLDEIERFEPGETIETIAPKLTNLAAEITSNIKTDHTAEEISHRLAPLLEYYLNDFNAELIAKKNILKIAKRLPLPDLVNQVNQLDTLENIILFMSILIENLKQMMPPEDCNQILGYFQRIHHNALQRLNCIKITTEHERLMKCEQEYRGKAINLFKEKQYASAKPFAQRSLEYAICIYTSNNPILSVAYYNYGRCLQELDKYAEAIECLNNAVKLCEAAPGSMDVKKVKDALFLAQNNLEQKEKNSQFSR